MTLAILDFGTNTFNLLIAERGDRTFRILHSSKQPVKLGSGGIHMNRITPDAFERGFVAIQNHLETIRSFGVTEIRVFATSAIRNASNGTDFVDAVRQRFGLRVRVIDGDREAELIYKGVRQAIRLTGEMVLILDIGGGSNEFILCNRDGIIWKRSFEIGMARILELFSLSDPITPEEVRAVESYYWQELQPLLEVVKKEKPVRLIGASGSFDTFYSLIAHRKGEGPDQRNGHEITMKDYTMIHRALLRSTLEERKTMPGMEPVRVEMIVAASIFVSFVLRSCHIRHLCQSAFALKEGFIAELAGL